jgi:hypothetical protein
MIRVKAVDDCAIKRVEKVIAHEWHQDDVNPR